MIGRLNMISKILKLMLFICIIFQVSCDISFKRKVAVSDDTKVKMAAIKKKTYIESKHKELFNKNDSQAITSYYSDKSNSTIINDMVIHTSVSKKQNSKLVVGKLIPRDIQVMPLPLKLERALSSLPIQLIRVQVGTKVILMNVKSRKILDIIKI